MKARLEKRNNGYFYIIVDHRSSGGGRETISTKTKVKKQAEKQLIEIQHKINNNEYKMTNKAMFTDFMIDWLSDYVKHNCKELTYETYKMLLEVHIIPYFEKLKLNISEIGPSHIQKYYYEKLKEGLSNNTVRKHHANIRKALDYAKKMQIITFNPADSIELPKRTKYKASFYDRLEVINLLEVMKNSTIESAVVLSVSLGLRRGEVLGLRWQDIDLIEGKLKITNNRVKFTNEINCTPKTEDSARELILPTYLLNYLIDLKNKHIGDSEYVCIMPNGKPIKIDYLSHKFNAILKQNNLKQIRFHDLRHTNASLLIAEGVDVKRIQGWLGHSQFQTTADIYSHLTDDYKNENAKILDKLIVLK